MAQLDPRDIVTLNLKYASAAKPLRTLAFAQLAAKVLFLAGGSLGVSKLAKRIAATLAVARVSSGSVLEGLQLLRDLGQATEEDQRWSLTETAHKDIQRHIDAADSDLEAVLRRHFPQSVDQPTLRLWFNESSAKVFGQYGDDWVASVCKGVKPVSTRIQPLAKLLGPVARKRRLEDHLSVLSEGYLAFLLSQDVADQQYLMSIGQAMFSARLVAADVGADPLTLDEFRDARIILDTNLAFAVALEDHRLGRSVRALARALQRIGAKPCYLRITLDEYGRALAGARRAILPIVELYPAQLVGETRDDFVSAACSQGAKTAEDFGRFFDSLRDPPRELASGVPVSIHEDEQVDGAIKTGEADEALKRRIQALANQMRPVWRQKTKSAGSLNHDAALIHVAERERQLGEKCWILSLDRSLNASGVERAGPHGMPPAISADALVEILAVNGAGPGVEASDFAPLLARMIINECAPPSNTFAIEDLRWLRNINEAVGELSADDTREIVRVVAKARAEGTPVSDPQLQLKVNRMFQLKRQEKEQAIADAQARAREAETLTGEERSAREEAEAELVKLYAADIVRSAWKELYLKLAWRIPVALAIGVAVWSVGRWLLPIGAPLRFPCEPGLTARSSPTDCGVAHSAGGSST